MNDTRVDIIIIGAGLTGLTLANKLKEEGKEILVLEAAERIGGRIHSLKTNDGAVVDLGATWFFPEFRNLLRILKKLKVELCEQYSSGYALFESHVRVPARKIKPSEINSFRIKGGASRIVDSLRKTLNTEEIQLGQRVQEIRYTPEGMEVVSNRKSFKCNKVITTLPPQLLLKSIRFSPSLPAELTGIMESTHTWMAGVITAAVTYKNPFWREKGLSGALSSNVGPFGKLFDQSTSDGKDGALVGVLQEKFARLSFEQRKQKVIDQLVRVFGENAKDYIEYRDTVWSREDLTSIDNPVKLPRHNNNGHKMYQAPFMDGRLFIGGSETATVGAGYMEGAVNSANTISNYLL